MSKKGSALMQVLVIGLIVATFSVLILRYAVTRSANLTRTNRILSSQIVAESCLDQYMTFQAVSELSGKPPCSINMSCIRVVGNGILAQVPISARLETDVDSSTMIITTFTIPVVATGD